MGRLHILHLEDNPQDVQLIRMTLDREGVACDATVVATREEFAAALERGGFDLILADYRLPAFDGLSALAMVRERDADLPFIFLSGVAGEETAIEAVRRGATDYVLKQRLQRLTPAVRRAMQEVRQRIERRRAEKQVRLACTVFDCALEAVLITAPDRTALMVNPAYYAMTGYAPEQVMGQVPGFFRCRGNDPSLYERIWQSVARTGHWKGEILDRKANGERYPVLLSLSAVANAAGAVTHYIALVSDISELKAAQQQLERLARYDSLTRLPNRSLFHDRLRHGLENAGRSGRRLAVLFVDLDNFKQVNDTLGHDAGDQLLAAVAARLKGCLRKGDTVARLGGDEFTVLVENLADPRAVVGIVRRLMAALTARLTIDGQTLHVCASIGVSIYPEDGQDAAALLRHADAAMYRAKAAGRNGYQFFSESMNAHARQRLSLEAELRRALDNGELFLLYQPQVHLASGGLCGVEALLRWRHPRHGVLAPAQFMAIAEETGLILPIGDWVLETAWRQLRAWTAQGLEGLRVAVNLSPRQFRQRDVVSRIGRSLGAADAAGRLELDLAESALMADVSAAAATLAEFKGMGLRIAIDDFGAGFSSVDCLRRFPLDQLKIDRPFVAEVPADAGGPAVAAAIIGMAHGLKLEVLAEGVETAAQLQYLRVRGCDGAQGFLFGRPLPAEAVAEVAQAGGEPAFGCVS
ncbi:MAG: EAL domain-containing protein [Pseudomonadota bacterium]|nr:EAL domain-containing protein [Pseudomonadota bacterium]